VKGKVESVMRINDGYNHQIAASPSRLDETARSEQRSQAAPQSGPDRDRTEVSSLASLVSRSITSTSSERSARIAELKQLYRAGEYQPDVQQTASNLIAAAIEHQGGD
jgi:anti-sigma28 factor (negative regulator of flagellin synthesis)